MPVYIIRAGKTDMVKIGWASSSVERRRRLLQCGHHEQLHVIRLIQGAPSLERQLHKHFAAHRGLGEWFRFDPEMMTITDLPEVGRDNRAGRAAAPRPGRPRAPTGAANDLRAATRYVLGAAGGASALAAKIGITVQAVSSWRRVPTSRAREVSRISCVPLHLVRPDLWDAPQLSEIISNGESK